MIEQPRTASRRLAATPTASGLAARLALARLQRLRIDAAPLLRECHLEPGDFAERRRINAIDQINFLQSVAHATGDDWIGLSLAEDFDLRELGLLYYVAASSKRLGDALRRLERYARIGNEALVVKVHTGDICRVALSYVGMPRHLDRHQIEMFAAGVLRLLRRLSGQRVTPVSAAFVHHRPDDTRRMRAAFGCDVQFGADADEICFGSEVLDLPVMSEDPYLNELMGESCENALAGRLSNVSPFRTTVENVIAPLLPHAEAGVSAVCRQLGLSERTFARRLAAEGLTFSEILDETRRALAVQYLAETGLQISQIAWLLGFHHPSAFSHACRRWTGQNPSGFRRAQSPASGPAPPA